ncbi:MAG: hypothetical protein JWR15_4133 [Prosthecobacter sp.]|nr:hypothetical protein [Prosthecobacter sp.]
MKWVLLLWCQTAFAGLTLSLNPGAQPVSAGAEALFSGTLTNTSATDKVFLNDVAVAFSADPQNDTALSSNAFFANVPGILLPGETYDGPLFRISLSGMSPAVNYTGTITFKGGADITASGVLVSTGITVLAKPVDQWKHRTFGDDAGSALAADDADWDHDGMLNLIEYALSPDGQSLPAPILLNGYLTLSYVPSAADVSYTIESSTNLLQWGTDDVEAITLANPMPPNLLTFRNRNTGRAFLRLKLARSP